MCSDKNFREYNMVRGKKYRHREYNEHIVEIIDIIDAKVYFRVNGVEFPRMETLVLYKYNEMLYVDEVVTFYGEYSPIEPVYEYQYAFKVDDDSQWKITEKYFTDKQAELFGFAEVQKLEFTKREVQNGRRYEDVK